jgi:hypothetical protein
MFQTKPEPGTEPAISVAASQMEWVKGINPHEWALGLFPRQRILARVWIGGDELEHAFMERGEAGAVEYFNQCLPVYNLLRSKGIYDVTGPNEPHPRSNNYAAYEAFELKWAMLVVSIGMKPWVWSFGVGWPIKETPARLFVGSIAYACAHGGGFEVHEYGAPAVMDGNGDWTLRLLDTLAQLYAAGLPKGTGRVFVGEIGVDGGVINWDEAPWNKKRKRRGWKEWYDWAYTGDQTCGLSNPHVMDRELYWRQVSWLDDRYCEIPEVVAATPFVTCPQQDWADFDWDTEMIRRSAEKWSSAPGPEPYLPHIVEKDVWDATKVLEKARWWLEQTMREMEAAGQANGEAYKIVASLAPWMLERELRLKYYD